MRNLIASWRYSGIPGLKIDPPGPPLRNASRNVRRARIAVRAIAPSIGRPDAKIKKIKLALQALVLTCKVPSTYSMAAPVLELHETARKILILR